MTTTLERPTAASDDIPARRRNWEYPALAVLLLGTAAAYLWNLSANGWANAFYSAAAQAGSVSWKAFLFGSSDASNAITVDKTPAALWSMDIAVRAFGLSSWSLLVPQVLMGVAAVALLWATVRRPFGPVAGLLAGAVLAVTPVAALMFRFNNPDALLVLLMVAACWAMTRANEDGRLRWLILCGTFIGFGFLTKQLQVLLVVPPLAATYLLAGPPRLGKRVAHLFAAAVAMIAGAGWWILIAELWAPDSRPYFGGSTRNSIIELTLGYNGLGRLNGDEVGSVTPGRGPDTASMWGRSGIGRMFDPAQGGQIAWLIPAALILLVAGTVLCGRATRTDARRAAFVMWGGWLLVTGLVFSYMKGIFHQYYTVALAPAIAALVGAGAVVLWKQRERLWVRLVAAVALAATTATAWILLSRSLDFVPWLRWLVLVGGVAVALALLIPAPRRVALTIAVAAGAIALAGPVAYTAYTLDSAQSGAIPNAGPRMPMSFGHGMHPPGGPFGPGAVGGAGRGTGGGGPAPDGTGPGGRDAPGGNFMKASAPSDEMTALLLGDAHAYRWTAATVSSNRAAGYQLATELPVMAVGGFNGTDPYPTLDQFREYVAAGDIHYFIAGGDKGPGGTSQDTTAAAITRWVEQNFTGEQVDGVTVYDLTTTA
ncbi:glycosyltransferase family 39 protein [Nocardia vermiculata]|uniref:Glycosyltransferase family 39 protein n=1 Tax=Nocardia vermiculata TaxID=257274 RepID=A0A846Y171_9NOCA|nr:glycosyltransferase family 39 protein [Nocardia vermiculata]NKY52597.1 glycosyltransferase family 39 protein [Nocardia vermiculata]